MYRLIGVLVIWLALTGVAAAQCSQATPSACPVPAMGGAYLGGPLTSVTGLGSLAGTWGGTPTWSGLQTFSGGATFSAAGTGLTVTNGFVINGSITRTNSTAVSATNLNPWLYGQSYYYGTYTSGLSAAINAVQTNDAISSASGNIYGFQSLLQEVTGWTGPRIALDGELIIQNSTTYCGTLICTFYVASEGDIIANANVGGTSSSNLVGNATGGAFSSTINTGASYYAGQSGVTVGTGITGTGSAGINVILSLFDYSTVQAYQQSSAITIAESAATASAVGLNYGISFGYIAGRWPFTSSSTMIGAVPLGLSQSQGTLPIIANYGIDFRQVDYATSAFASPGIAIDGSGEFTSIAANGVISRTSAGIKIDIPNLLVTACAIGGNIGAAYVVNDIVREPNSGTLCQITSVNGGGNVTGITLAQPGATVTSNPTNQAVTGGTGNQLLTVNLTTATRNTLALNPSGGNVVVNGNANTGANNTFAIDNSGSASTTGTVSRIQATLSAGTNQFIVMNVFGGASPGSIIQSGSGNTAGLQIQSVSGAINLIPATALQINGTAGVTCSGAPTGAFASINGIVTHC